MPQTEKDKKELEESKNSEDIKRYLPYRAKGDIDDYIFEGNCMLRHSER